MTSPHLALRTRVLLGATLWTIGIFAVLGVVMTHVMYHYPGAPRLFHDIFLNRVAVSTFALLCLIVGLFQVRGGLSAIDRLRLQLAAVHQGRERLVSGSYPAEVQPLVDDLNTLLEHREHAVRRAVSRAGDLAHGLKTPLAVLSQEAERAAAAGQQELAGAVSEQVERMRRQVDTHLAHARAAASGATPGARCMVAESAQGLARTMLRLHAERGLAVSVAVAREHSVRCQREDLDEMLGNLLDNACKWGRARVSITSSAGPQCIVIAVEDDGPGLDPSMRVVVLQRGVRADEAAPGSGLGLAIVRDLAELYGGTIALDRSADGGLRAQLTLPGVQ